MNDKRPFTSTTSIPYSRGMEFRFETAPSRAAWANHEFFWRRGCGLEIVIACCWRSRPLSFTIWIGKRATTLGRLPHTATICSRVYSREMCPLAFLDP